MRPEYTTIFDELLNEYRLNAADPYVILGFRRQSNYFLPIKIGDIIESVIGKMKLGNKVRPDAKHFLLVNIHQMVVLPYSKFVDQGNGMVREGDFDWQQAIREDVEMILNEVSPDISQEGEISGHDVIESVSKVWDKLKSSSAQIWG